MLTSSESVSEGTDRDFTDFTLANEDTDEYDEEDCTDVTLVSDDTYWKLDWCDPGEWWYQSKTWLMLL